jgi:signal transduction histidine kinase
MNALRLFALLVYTFGMFAYGAILALWIREMGRVGWGARTQLGVSGREVDALNGALFGLSFLWFGCNVAALIASMAPHGHIWQLDAATIVLAFCFPPVIMHVSWTEAAHGGDRPLSRGWRLALWPAYILGLGLPLWALVVLYGPQALRSFRIADALLSTGLSAAFIGAAAYCIALVTRKKEEVPSLRERQSRRSIVMLFACMIAVFMLLFVFSAFSGTARSMAVLGGLLEVSAKSLPLVFVFVGTYYENRFQFFDLFVKRGLGFVMAMAVLTIWLALMLPALRPVMSIWAAPWIFAIALVPVVVVIPWLYVMLSHALDRRWLGRRYSTEGALTHFIGGLRSATTEAQLIDRAQKGLAEIFGAEAVVTLGDTTPGRSAAVQTLPVRSGDAVVGHFRMGTRVSDAPYFSQDVQLLGSLADVFAHVLENLHLQERKLEQEQRARELSLHASRSELKALRAQINPHFLFNALNSIAGLIHRDPAVADRTIEQLADVFRYALRGAESEWAVLDDEMDFVRAYLEVERARFGDRLQTEVRIEDPVRGVRIPTMIVQTLVENAVKHGAASVRGSATVVVHARVDDGKVVVSVSDNGPGFTDPERPAAPRARGGYGLVNVRQRLEGYFGSAAALSVSRDAGRTVVSVSLPFLRQEPRVQPAPQVTR